MRLYQKISKILILLVLLVFIVKSLYGLLVFSINTNMINNFFDRGSYSLLNSRIPMFRAIQYVDQNVDNEDLVLIFRQNDFKYYSDNKFIRHLDPRMIPVLEETSKEKAFEALSRLGVKYILIPSYMVPTYSDTIISEIVSDCRLCLPVVDIRGVRLFRVLSKGSVASRSCSSRDILFPTDYQAYFYNSLASRGIGFSGGKQTEWIVSNTRKATVVLPIPLESLKGLSVQGIEGGKSAYHMELSIEGEGWLQVDAVSYDEIGQEIRSRLWESAFSDQSLRITDNYWNYLENYPGKYSLVLTVQTEKPFRLTGLSFSKKYISGQVMNGYGAGSPWSLSNNDRQSGSIKRERRKVIISSINPQQMAYTGLGSYLLPAGQYHTNLLNKVKGSQGGLAAYQVSFEVSGNCTVKFSWLDYASVPFLDIWTLRKTLFFVKKFEAGFGVIRLGQKSRTVSYKILVSGGSDGDGRLAVQLGSQILGILPEKEVVLYPLLKFGGQEHSYFGNKIVIRDLVISKIESIKSDPQIQKCYDLYGNALVGQRIVNCTDVQ